MENRERRGKPDQKANAKLVKELGSALDAFPVPDSVIASARDVFSLRRDMHPDDALRIELGDRVTDSFVRTNPSEKVQPQITHLDPDAPITERRQRPGH